MDREINRFEERPAIELTTNIVISPGSHITFLSIREDNKNGPQRCNTFVGESAIYGNKQTNLL